MSRTGPKHARPHRRAVYMLIAAVGVAVTGTGAAKLGSSLISYDAARSAWAASGSAGPTENPADGTPSGAAGATTGTSTPTPTPTPTPTQTVLPVRIEISDIHVNAPVQELGLTSTGALAVPTQTNQAGWYTGSAVPGQSGPSVIAGHYDSAIGPAVFYELRDLKDGDDIDILLSSGTTVTYQVTGIVTDSKEQFPTTEVYGPSPDGELRLITCSGSLVDGSYLDNLIVFARLVDSA